MEFRVSMTYKRGFSVINGVASRPISIYSGSCINGNKPKSDSIIFRKTTCPIQWPVSLFATKALFHEYAPISPAGPCPMDVESVVI